MDDLKTQFDTLTITTKPLLILDLNGILIYREFIKSDIVYNNGERIGNFNIWKRPKLQEFLDFIFSKFHVAVFSSITKKNIEKTVQYVFGEKYSLLKFIYNQDNCVKVSKFNSKDHKRDITFRKNLQIIWNKFPDFNLENTLIIDDSPEKMRYNPSHCYFIPETWTINNENDTSLSPGGIIYQRIVAFYNRVTENSNCFVYKLIEKITNLIIKNYKIILT